MKFIHLSDLHIGKRVNEFPMLEDQIYILNKIINIVDRERPQAVFIAGDVYDKSVPSGEGVQILNGFLEKLSAREIPTFIISGNHDSAERLSFGNKLMMPSGVNISPVYHRDIEPITFEDCFGDIDVYMLPFVKPATVRPFFAEEIEEETVKIVTYDDAVRVAVKDIKLDTSRRNIILAHQFVTGAQTSESEEFSVGGTDNISADIFDDFDYVALGHIHGPQHVSRESIRYCGTPLKYSFSEAKHQKSVTVVDMEEKGVMEIRTVPLEPLRDMVEIKGEYMEICSKDFYEGMKIDNYIHVTLTDEKAIPDAITKLRIIYPNIMKLDYDNTRTRKTTLIDGAVDVEHKSPIELFKEFYVAQNNQEISEEQLAFVTKLMEEIKEAE